MRLHSIAIKNLYGSLSKSVNFNESMNLLVGINGSGKTSVLNFIDWCLTPSLPRLSVNYFDQIIVKFDHGGKNYRVHVKQTSRDLAIEVSEVGGRVLAPIKVNLRDRPPKGPTTDFEEGELLEKFSNLGPEPHERPAWNFLKSLPKPVVISLDRTISAEADEEIYREEIYRSVNVRRTIAATPLHKVRSVTTERYALYRSRVIELNNKLKNKIILAAFDATGPVRPSKSRSLVSASDVDALQRKVLGHLSLSAEDRTAERIIRQYFLRLKRILKQVKNPGEELIYSRYFAERFRMIDGLARAFKDYETKAADSFQTLRAYLTTVNNFLQDSRKIVGFDDKTNELKFNFLNSLGVPVGDSKRIEHLSSGERQIVILFTFLTFVADKDCVVIVDEPELSLHPKWQKNFLQAVDTLKPKGGQILIATHSPEIVGRYRDACIVLRP